jgi:hypothetical protein
VTPTKDVPEMGYVSSSGGHHSQFDYDCGRAPVPRLVRRGRKRRPSSHHPQDEVDWRNTRRKVLRFNQSPSPQDRMFRSMGVRNLSEDRSDLNRSPWFGRSPHAPRQFSDRNYGSYCEYGPRYDD